MKAYYEQLFAYKTLMEHGGDEMKANVQALIDEYHQYLASGMKDTGVRWEFRKKDEDELKAGQFGTIILYKETADKSVQLEVLNDFGFKDSRYRHCLVGADYRLVRIYEQDKKSMFSNAKRQEFFLTKKENGYDLRTVKGEVLKPRENIITQEQTILFAEEEKE